MAQKFIRENLSELQREKIESPSAPSKRAHAVGNTLGRLVGKVLK